MAPPSVESPTLAIGILATKTLLEPTLITAGCETQLRPEGIVCAAVGLPLHSTAMLLAKTLAAAPVGPVMVVVLSQPCPVVVGSPCLAIAGILVFTQV